MFNVKHRRSSQLFRTWYMQKITLDTTYDAIFKEVYKIVKDR
jgi:hypothetical protein